MPASCRYHQVKPFGPARPAQGKMNILLSLPAGENWSQDSV
ncbi:MAG: hypothetical protein ACMUIA_08285 [bacterium]